MKKLLVVLFIAAELSSFAQKAEKIEYFTDSDVKRSIVAVQLGYMPYFSSRRLLATSVNPQAGFYLLNSSVTGKFGQGYGGDLLFNLTKNFQVGVGLYETKAHYQWDLVNIVDNIGGNGDTLEVQKWDIYAKHLSVPIQFGYVMQVADQWWLQVYPALELNYLQSLEYKYILKSEDAPREIDKTQEGTSFNMAISFGLGAEYRITEKFGVFSRLQFRYYFYPLDEDEVVRELLYTVGAHVGIKYHF